MKELLSLPGVGRKTANCVLVYGFHKDAIPVDVHVHRISNRIGLADTRTPEETEEVLMVTHCCYTREVYEPVLDIRVYHLCNLNCKGTCCYLGVPTNQIRVYMNLEDLVYMDSS